MEHDVYVFDAVICTVMKEKFGLCTEINVAPLLFVDLASWEFTSFLPNTRNVLARFMGRLTCTYISARFRAVLIALHRDGL